MQLFIVPLLLTGAASWAPAYQPGRSNCDRHSSELFQGSTSSADTSDDTNADVQTNEMFDEFVGFLKGMQSKIIGEIEDLDGSGKSFSTDNWGVFETGAETTTGSGGITRVLQGGNVVEKGACSLTLIQQGVLTSERAAAIRSRQDVNIKAGDTYSAAALSIVLHTRSPMIPTFRSDVRVFSVQSESGMSTAWFGGGADLTPYYLFDSDVTEFHNMYRDICQNNEPEFSYEALKKCCDDYFYLPARSEHRGTGGIFFDDLALSSQSMDFVKSVASSWMPSWVPIVTRRRDTEFSEQQKQWQLLRRGRYLEFNLLYDRGVKFGLANANPRVEGVMVSAPPLIAWEYNYKVEDGSDEARLLGILKSPQEWATK